MAGLAVLAIPAFSQAVYAQSYPVIHYGDRGPAVKTAEESLQKLGFYHGAIDSAFGPELLFAVKSFQGHYGLAQDGIVGPETWTKLSVTVGTPTTTSSNASPNYAAAPLLLQLNSAGPAVVHLQELLNQHGYDLTVDGQFGPLTYAAVRNFQATHHLVVDGIAGPETLGALEQPVTSNTASAQMEAPPPPYEELLREGDSGYQVVMLQKDLSHLGYSTGPSGVFGYMTLRAVESFQMSNGLAPDGIVGPLTWKAFNEAMGMRSAIAGASQPLANRGSVSPTASAVVGLALKYDGYRYVFGGNSPASGFDCSGFVQWVYSEVGISLPRTSFSQWNVGVHVSYDELQPGDLVFFTTDGVFANHVGIYLGNGEFISAASPGQGVVVQSLTGPFFAQAFDGAVRVIG